MPKCKPLPPVEVLNRWFRLDRETGKLYWKESSSQKIHVGDEAGSIRTVQSGHKRCVISVPGYGNSKFYRYRIIWKMVYGVDPVSDAIDHIDQDSLNDRPSNLADGGRSWNGRNKAVTAKTGHRGVIKINNRWRVSYTHYGKSVHVGVFDSPEQAAAAYERARQRLKPVQPATLVTGATQ